MSAAFTFDKYKLIELSYKPELSEASSKSDEGIDAPNKEKKYNISLSANISVGLEKVDKYRMELSVNVTGSINAQIRLYGYFSGTGFYENHESEQKELLPIGIALLLPIARSILASISAQDGSVPFLLPTVNVSEFITNSDNTSIGQDA